MVNDMVNDKTILVGVDGSHASYKATWWAANYAKHAGLTLQIVCTYSLPSYAAVSFDATYTAMGDDNAAHNDAQEILSKAKAIADEQGVKAATLIVTGDPASVFVELSRNYNLIVIGNRGKGGLAERLLGTSGHGEITVAGLPNKTPEARRILGYIPELPSLYPNLTVSEHMEFLARAYRLSDYKGRVDALFERFEVLAVQLGLGDAAVILERPYGSNEDNGVRPEACHAALDIQKLLSPEIGGEPGLRHQCRGDWYEGGRRRPQAGQELLPRRLACPERE